MHPVPVPGTRVPGIPILVSNTAMHTPPCTGAHRECKICTRSCHGRYRYSCTRYAYRFDVVDEFKTPNTRYPEQVPGYRCAYRYLRVLLAFDHPGNKIVPGPRYAYRYAYPGAGTCTRVGIPGYPGTGYNRTEIRCQNLICAPFCHSKNAHTNCLSYKLWY